MVQRNWKYIKLSCALMSALFLVSVFIPMLGVGAQTDDYIYEVITIEGIVYDDVVYFNFSGILNVEHERNATIKLLGPPGNLGINSIRFDNQVVQVYFSEDFYYIYVHLTEGTHSIKMEFESSLSKYGLRSLSYRLFGPALKYTFNVEIPKNVGTEIDVTASEGANVEDMGDRTQVSWRMYAIRDKSISLSWDSPVEISGVDLQTEAQAMAEIGPTSLMLSVMYSLKFPDRSLDQLSFMVPSWMELVRVSPEFIWYEEESLLVPLSPVHDRVDFTAEFKMVGETYNLNMPRPSIGSFFGTVVVIHTQAVEAEIVAVIDANPVDDPPIELPFGTKILGSWSVTDDSSITVGVTEVMDDKKASVLAWFRVGPKRTELREVIDISVVHQEIDYIYMAIPTDFKVEIVDGVFDWKVNDGVLELMFPDGFLGDKRIELMLTAPTKNRTISPLVPNHGFEVDVYLAGSSVSDVKVSYSASKAKTIDLNELPTDFMEIVNVPQIVRLYKGEKGATLTMMVELRETVETRTTVIEFAQYTLIKTRDGKIMARIAYFTKNMNQEELRVSMPPGGMIWYVLVAGKVTQIMTEESDLIIPLVRSTVSGKNIPFIIEIMYVIPERSMDFDFILPTVDIPIVGIEVNIGVPKDTIIIHPQIDNPDFEFAGAYRWDIATALRGGLSWADPEKKPVPAEDSAGLSFQTGFWQISNDAKAENRLDLYKPDMTSGFVNLQSGDSNEELLMEDIEIYKASTDSSYIKYSWDAVGSPDPQSKDYRTKLAPGQYIIEYGNSTRYVQVLPGMDQQVILTKSDIWSEIQMPPMDIVIPSTGKLLRFKRIFISSMEDFGIGLTEGEPEVETPAGALLFTIAMLFGIIVTLAAILKKKEGKAKPAGSTGLQRKRSGPSKEGRKKKEIKVEEDSSLSSESEPETSTLTTQKVAD